jgi:hypothetical protein
MYMERLLNGYLPSGRRISLQEFFAYTQGVTSGKAGPGGDSYTKISPTQEEIGGRGIEYEIVVGGNSFKRYIIGGDWGER